MATYSQNFIKYLETLKTNYTKLAKLDFLNPDGSVAFSLDNQTRNKQSKAFIQEGTITCNLQNGRRRQADVTLVNLNGEYDYAINKIWFGQEIRLSEGLILPDGTEFYIPQGVFIPENPEEIHEPNNKTAHYQLSDKWAAIDGSLGGNLEGVYQVNAGTNIFTAMQSLLQLDRFTMAYTGSNYIDRIAPLFTNYYNNRTQTLTDGTTVSYIISPYDYSSNENGTMADVLLGLAEMLAAWIGYNSVGRLVVDPSQDDILDSDKPVLWDFSTDSKQLVRLSYAPKPTEVYNDVIITGSTNDVNYTASGRAQNRDPSSDTCISRIGLKTLREEKSDYYSDDICLAYADWKLKRSAVLSKTVTLTTTQMFHIVENGIITVKRTDKTDSPIERHLVQGFSRPIGQSGTMSINAVSVNDYPISTPVFNDNRYHVIGNTLYVPEGAEASITSTTLNIGGTVSGTALTLSNPT